MQRPVDNFLFERLSKGEPEALDEICRRYGKRVAALVRRRLGPALRAREETDDIAQETMVDILKGASKCHFDSEAAFLRWLQVVVEHRVLHTAEYWRAARRRASKEVRFSTALLDAEPHAESPSAVLQRREEIDRLSLELARLPSEDREVIISRLFLKLPWAAVAAAMGTTEEAAQMRFTRARRKLVSQLA
ncbi:MAG: sigma-70 family RNA polymerase sigma factor [Planctomycetes bacterium]|nr:sigma-70 family RNA polymerase sigma factor [Planctomycetota bacterium]